MEIRFHKKALEDITDSYDYYNSQQENLGDKFINAVDKQLDLIKSFPLRARIVYHNYRQISTKVFPFLIIYTYNKKLNRISISAIHHASKHPSKKFRKF